MLPRQDVLTLDAPDPALRKLLSLGFASAADLEGTTQAQLVQEAQLTPLEAQAVLRALVTRQTKAAVLQGAVSAAQLASREERGRPLVTFCMPLDSLLAVGVAQRPGGIAMREVTEICGVPGVGKTQLGMQLAVDVQIPRAFAGLAGSAVYIDTEGGFTAERAREVAQAAHDHLGAISRNDRAKQYVAESLTVDALLDNIFLFRPHSYQEQESVLAGLPAFLERVSQQEGQAPVRVVVLDSLAFHLRWDGAANFAERSRQLAETSQHLQWLAATFELAVVIVNHLTTKVVEGRDSELVASLGASWAHAPTTRLTLSWRGSARHAALSKSPRSPAGEVEFEVAGKGFRGRTTHKRKPSAAPQPGA